MPHFVRADIRLERWYIHPEITWLPPGEVQADALADLKPKAGSVSVFEVDDKISPERIAIAVAAGRQKPVVMGYAIFDGSTVIQLGLKLQKVYGLTPDDEVNALHYDIQELTGQQLNQLAKTVVCGEITEILSKQVKQLLEGELKAGHLDRRRVNTKLLERLLKK